MLTASGYTTQDPVLTPSPPPPPHQAIFTFDPISLNRADQQTLAFLPGIGPTLARRIIEHRQVHGPFQSTDQLLQVPGIGPKTLERIHPLVSP
ncbi:MAG: ComEA family DNA-binding protein [Desulfurivibrio sp.]